MALARNKKRNSHSASAEPKDGGAWCLVGFLYQLLGSAAVSIQEAPTNTENLSARFVQIEQHGQDAVTRSGGTIRLIQFKYSDHKKPIGPAEFLKIVNTFRKSERVLRARTSWLLTTNRPLSKKTQSLRSGPLPQQSGDRKVAKSIRRLKSRFDVDASAFSQFRAKILERAAGFGIDENPDISQRVIGYLSDLVLQPEGQRQVSRSRLDGAIAGYEAPQSISAADPDCRSRLRTALSNLATQLHAPPLSDVLPRRDVEKMLREPSIALAIVCGPGGSGKTISVVKALHDYINEKKRLAGALMPGDFPTRSTLPELVASWRSTYPRAPESLTQSLNRIRIANRVAERPILLLALDGIDENDSQAEAGEVLGHFMALHQKPDQQDALLIVTCREPDQLEGLIGAQGAGGMPLRAPHLVRLDDFTREEFDEVWERWFGTEPPDVSQSSDAESTFGTPQLPSHIGVALRHPIFLGCFRGLDEEQRERFLNDEPEPWRVVMDRYLEWFSVKVNRRLRLNLGTTKRILRAAAAATVSERSETTYQLETHWIQPGMRETSLTRPELKRVFDDAITAGIVDVDGERYSVESAASRPWRWRFTQLRDHLVTSDSEVAS